MLVQSFYLPGLFLTKFREAATLKLWSLYLITTVDFFGVYVLVYAFQQEPGGKKSILSVALQGAQLYWKGEWEQWAVKRRDRLK